MTKRTRTQIADEIVLAAFVFARRARRNGSSNQVTKTLIAEIAQTRRYRDGVDYSHRTCYTLARKAARKDADDWALLADELR